MGQWQAALQPIKQTLRELDMSGVTFLPPTILARTNDLTVLKMILPNTSNARQHLLEQTSKLSLGPAMIWRW